MTVIYIDRVFALNLALDYMLLLICARLAGTPLRRLRCLLWAAGGALYAAAVFLPGCAALNGPVFRLLAGLAMPGHHVGALHHYALLRGEGRKDLALLALVLAGDDDYGIVFLDVKLLHCVSSIKALRVQGRLSSCSP